MLCQSRHFFDFSPDAVPQKQKTRREENHAAQVEFICRVSLVACRFSRFESYRANVR
jgi:hypothetical protein